jgi:hypothetical protein
MTYQVGTRRNRRPVDGILVLAPSALCNLGEIVCERLRLLHVHIHMFSADLVRTAR